MGQVVTSSSIAVRVFLEQEEQHASGQNADELPKLEPEGHEE